MIVLGLSFYARKRIGQRRWRTLHRLTALAGRGPRGAPAAAVAAIERSLLQWHRRFTRFEPGSELSRLNADPRGVVPVSPMMARFAEAVVAAAEAPRRPPPGTSLAGDRGRPRGRHHPPAPWAEARRRRAAEGPARRRARRAPGRARLVRRRLRRRPAARRRRARHRHRSRRLAAARARPARLPAHRRRRGHQRNGTPALARRGRPPRHHLLDPSTGRPAFTGHEVVAAR
jgi:thiamine biosynthesis lipoprotein